MKILQKCFSYLSLAILIASCGALLLFGWSATGWRALAIPTSSMSPAIPQGSLVLVNRVPITSLKVGDVITYINPLNLKTTLSHRIVKKYLINGKIPAFVTKGDANKTADLPITEGSVIGRVVWQIPNAGNWLLSLKNPIILLPFIYLVAVLVSAEEIKRLGAYYKLSQPYKAACVLAKQRRPSVHYKKFGWGLPLAIGLAITAAGLAPPASALLSSNLVSLAPNNITVTGTPLSQCTSNTSNNNSINVINNSSQSGSSGSSTVNGNTNGGSATSGSVSNSNSSSTTINIKNC